MDKRAPLLGLPRRGGGPEGLPAVVTLGVVAFSAAFQLAMHHGPVVRTVFGLTPVSLRDGLLSIALGLVPVTILELSKLLGRNT